jgi:hypothetical protein
MLFEIRNYHFNPALFAAYKESLPGSNGEIFGAKELRFTLQWLVRYLRKRPYSVIGSARPNMQAPKALHPYAYWANMQGGRRCLERSLCQPSSC